MNKQDQGLAAGTGTVTEIGTGQALAKEKPMDTGNTKGKGLRCERGLKEECIILHP